jgi:hypothetical protein
VSLVDPITALEYEGDKVRFLPFEPVMTTDFSVLTPARRPPSTLVTAFTDHVRRMALRELDPSVVVA